MARPFLRSLAFAAGLSFMLATIATASEKAPGVGSEFETLKVGKREYRQVKVRGVSVRSISFTHAEGLASAPLKELPPELQLFFQYDPAKEAEADRKAEDARVAQAAEKGRSNTRTLQREASLASRFDRLVKELDTSPVLLPEVDLRPKFRALSLTVKDQGRRPSCAIFAIVSALEFQNAQLTGRAEKLSEEYLLWAARKSTRRLPLVNPVAQPDEAATETREDNPDEGFSLGEVVASLRSYGIPPQTSMPNTFGKHIDAVPDPSEQTIEEARNRRRVFVHSLNGRERATRVEKIIHALNAEVPVVIGARWPNARAAYSGFLSEQKPVQDYAHAVTLIGYKCESGKVEESVFLFKNSYGVSWGQGGYGWMTYAYLSEHLLDAVMLEVQRGEGA